MGKRHPVGTLGSLQIIDPDVVIDQETDIVVKYRALIA